MITLSLFDTLLALNCEDLMLELMLKYLLNCQHVPISHRYKVNRSDPYGSAVEYFLNVAPDIMKKVNNVLNTNNYNGNGSSAGNSGRQTISKTIGANWNHYGMNTGETLLASYQAYLLDARNRITQCKHACDQWNNIYRYQKLSKLVNSGVNGGGHSGEDVRTYKVQMIKNFLAEFTTTAPDSAVELLLDQQQQDHRSSQCQSPAQQHQHQQQQLQATTKQLDSLQSLGDSSGYESLNIMTICSGGGSAGGSEDGRRHESWKVSSVKEDTVVDLDLSEDLFAQGTVSLGETNCCLIRREITLLIYSSNRSLSDGHLGQAANLHQQLSVRESTPDRVNKPPGVVPAAAAALDTAAARYSDHVRHAVLPSGQ